MGHDESLGWAVTEEQRDRTVDFLSDQYAEGRLDSLEFDARVGQALKATTRRELNSSLEGLARVPLHRQAVTGAPAFRSIVPGGDSPATLGAALTHWSALAMGPLGPGVVYAVAQPASLLRKEAAKAFNFQMLSLVLLVLLGGIGAVTGVNWPLALWSLGWFGLTVVGGVKAAQGADWSNPLQRVIPLRVLDEGKRDRRRQLGR